MCRLIVLAAVLAITAARPETYREKEDFQYSRSSSDDGTKAGYYGAQRGNMGGNYERAHNMDTLAQHQMSGLVRQTQGELGDGVNQRSGSVFTAANSQGMYGSGRYDLSDVQGRNFQEGVSYDSAHSQSSLSSQNSGSMGQLHSSVNHGGYDSSNAYDSRHRGYSSTKNSNQLLYANNQHQSADDLQSANQQQSAYESHGSGHNLQSGYHRESGYNQANYDSSNRYGSNVHNRLVGASMPVRVVVRPGTIVTVPIAAQTYDAGQSSSSFDHNAINTEAEALNGHDQLSGYRPTNKEKHYESSYNYRKEWERHDTQPAGVPLSIPTVSPYPKNSELYEDTQAHNSEHRQAASSVDSHRHSSYNVEAAASSQSRHQAGYNSQHHGTASNADSRAYRTGDVEAAASSQSRHQAGYNSQHQSTASNADSSAALNQVLNSQVEDLSTKPKNYQSSYSYHKSWERQGDPYVIIPTNNDNAAAQKLVTSHRGAYGDTHQYGTHQHYDTNQQRYFKIGDADCDENGQRITRVARSADFENQQQEDLTQQTQTQWDDLGQRSQNIEDLGQQTQNLDFTQQSQHEWDKYEDLGQQTQNLELTQQNQNKWDKYEDLGQQTQHQWSPQTTGQQTEQFQVEDLGQQTQNQWTQHETEQKPNWNTLELEPQSQTSTLQIENKEIIIPTTKQSVQKEENSEPDNSKITGRNDRDIRISNADKGNDEIHPVGNQEFQGVNINDYHNSNKDQMSDNLGQQIQDIIRKMNSNVQQTQSFYGHSGYHKQSFDDDHSTQNNNNYQQNWHVAEHSGASDINKYLDSSNNFQSQNAHPLSSIWDRLDSIEKQSNKDEQVHNFDIDNPAGVGPNENSTKTAQLTEKPLTERIETTSKIASTTKLNDNVNEMNTVRPQDIGRGDIGADDVLNTVTTSRPHSTTNSHKSREVKPLNLGNSYDKSKQTTTETIFNEKKNSSDNLEQSTQNEENYEQQASNFGQDSNFEKQSTNFEQQSTNYEQQATNFEQQSTDFEQQSTNFEQQSTDFEQQSTHLEDSPNFEQQSTNFEQQSTNLEDSPNFDQQSTNFEQQSTNFEQQATNFEQQSNNFEHQSNNFEQQSNNFEQQSNNFEQQQSNNFEQQQSNNFEQSTNLEDSSNLEQEHLPKQEQHLTNFEHNLPTSEQQLPSVQEHFLNADQHSTNFEQQSDNFDEQLGMFEQQSTNLEPDDKDFLQQSLPSHMDKDFEIEENIEKQVSVPLYNEQGHWVQKDEEFKQNKRSDNLNQQMQREWDPKDLQQSQNVGVFSPVHETPENVDQQRKSELVIPLETAVTESTPEPVTEKGFWTSVSSKFSQAKDKVKSWFSK